MHDNKKQFYIAGTSTAAATQDVYTLPPTSPQTFISDRDIVSQFDMIHADFLSEILDSPSSVKKEGSVISDCLDSFHVKRELHTPTNCGSMPNLLTPNSLDAQDNMDVSDWLDVVLPGTGMTPLTTSAPVSFSNDGDPLLAAVNFCDGAEFINQDAIKAEPGLNINLDDIDFNMITTPTDLSSLAWDKVEIPQ